MKEINFLGFKIFFPKGCMKSLSSGQTDIVLDCHLTYIKLEFIEANPVSPFSCRLSFSVNTNLKLKFLSANGI